MSWRIQVSCIKKKNPGQRPYKSLQHAIRDYLICADLWEVGTFSPLHRFSVVKFSLLQVIHSLLLPQYPESQNINRLVYEVRSDLQSAITFYQQARFALGILSNSNSENINDLLKLQWTLTGHYARYQAANTMVFWWHFEMPIRRIYMLFCCP